MKQGRGRPPLGEKAMTGKERLANFRQRKAREQLEIHLARGAEILCYLDELRGYREEVIAAGDERSAIFATKLRGLLLKQFGEVQQEMHKLSRAANAEHTAKQRSELSTALELLDAILESGDTFLAKYAPARLAETREETAKLRRELFQMQKKLPRKED